MESKVGTVIVTYNRLTLLKEAVEALRQQTYLNQQIIIVNNGSTDSTAEWLQKQKDIVIMYSACFIQIRIICLICIMR